MIESSVLTAEELGAIVEANHCQPNGKIMEGLVPVLERIIKDRDDVWRESVSGVVEARYAGDFSPILPKLIALIGEAP